MVNREREAKGLPAVQRHPGLDQLASEHSEAMVRQAERSHRINITHHGFDDRARIARIQYFLPRSAENVGVTAGISGEQAVAATMVREWMNSSGHRKNILQPWEASGIGVSQAGDGLGVYVTQIFGSRN